MPASITTDIINVLEVMRFNDIIELNEARQNIRNTFKLQLASDITSEKRGNIEFLMSHL